MPSLSPDSPKVSYITAYAQTSPVVFGKTTKKAELANKMRRILPYVIVLGWVFPLMLIWNVIRSRRRGNIPLIGLFFSLTAAICWLIYGLCLEEFPLLMTASFGIFSNSALIFLYLFYATDEDDVEEVVGEEEEEEE